MVDPLSLIPEIKHNKTSTLYPSCQEPGRTLCQLYYNYLTEVKRLCTSVIGKGGKLLPEHLRFSILSKLNWLQPRMFNSSSKNSIPNTFKTINISNSNSQPALMESQLQLLLFWPIKIKYNCTNVNSPNKMVRLLLSCYPIIVISLLGFLNEFRIHFFFKSCGNWGFSWT